MSSEDWQSIRRVWQAERYAVRGDADGYRAESPAHGFAIHHRPNGTTVLTPNRGDEPWTLALRLAGLGYETLQPLNRLPSLEAERNELTYRWGEGLTEWWVNSPEGLEQWFRIDQRPASGTGAEPLRLALEVTGNLRPFPREDGAVDFTRGSTSITYRDLVVWDARGHQLEARMEIAEGRLALHVDDAEAHYPVTIDPTFFQQAYLKASNAGSSDRFGSSVAISGDTAVVGAWGEDSRATGVNGDQTDSSASAAGAAYVFVRDGAGTWSQQAYLKASNTGLLDQFGSSVAISGDTAVVGAIAEDSSATGVEGDQTDNSASAAGAAYVFVRDGAGTWSQQAYLKASNTRSFGFFGLSVAISGDTALVGALDSASNAGAAYVFVRDGAGTWSQQAYLEASNSDSLDVFGISVAISGDTAVVGASAEDSNATGVDGDQTDDSAENAGAAYVFVRDGAGTWSQQAYLKASNTGSFDQFGVSVAVSGDTAVVGATAEDSSATGVDGNQTDDSATLAGAAYVFVRDGAGTWSQQAYLKASNTEALVLFGGAVAISGDTVVVGARDEDSSATGVDGDQTDDAATAAGAAYVFVRDGAGTWSQRAYLKASNTGSSDFFGGSVAISGETVVVGAPEEDSRATGVDGDQTDNSAGSAGAAYVFVLASPTLSLAKSGAFNDESSDGAAQAGETISYSFVVTNTGNQTLGSITVSDPVVSPITCPSGNPIPSLAPTASETCAGTYTVIQADVDAGSKDNTATAAGEDPEGDPVTDSDTTTTSLPTAPSVSATKASGFDLVIHDNDGSGDLTAGDSLAYHVTITNSGSGDATGVLFDDTPDPNTGLTVGSVTTTQGTVVLGNAAGDAAVQVDVGTVASGGGSAIVTFEVTIDDHLPEGVTSVANQGAVSGGNFASVVTDDPGTASGNDATSDEVNTAAAEIPTLSQWGVLLLALLLSTLAARQLRRQRVE